MKISYDPEIDALYIRLIEGKHECRTVRLNEEIALKIGPDEKLVGIEILDATEVLGQGHVPDAGQRPGRHAVYLKQRQGPVIVQGQEPLPGRLDIIPKFAIWFSHMPFPPDPF